MNKNIDSNDIEQIVELKEKLFPEVEIKTIDRLGGLTNHSYHITMTDSQEYVFRLPGDGTEEIINRSHEKISTELACDLDIDTELLFFDADTGKKVSRYIKNAITMSPNSMKEEKNIIDAAKVLKKLHTSEIDTKVPFEVFDMANEYERFIKKNDGSFYEDYSIIREKVMQLKEEVDKLGYVYVSSHNDPLCENWIRSGDRMYLVDWEYAGMNSPFWDLADVSIEAELDEEQDILILESYLGRHAKTDELFCFQANKIYLDFLWSLWGKTRVPFEGESMERYALERYNRMKLNLKKIAPKF